jgi:hypothetical protein
MNIPLRYNYAVQKREAEHHFEGIIPIPVREPRDRN